MKIRCYALITTALTGVMIAGGAYAQTSQASAAGKTGDGGDVVVVVKGIRASIKSSRDTKRKTDAVIDVITAEDVGKFPDKNVAESLSHLTGIAVDRQFGEGERVSIHGTDPALNRIFVDNHSIATANWGGDPNDKSGRTFNYNLLAPELIGQARVFKSPEAWIDEGSLGGTVLMDTRKPLSLAANTFSGSMGYAYNDRSAIGNGRGSVLYSWKNQAGTLGILAAATYNREDLKQSGIEYFGYGTGSSAGTPTTINGATPTASSLAAYNSAVLPIFMDHDDVEQVRERTGYSLTAQWKPADNLELTLSALDILGNYSNFNQAEYFWPGSPTNMNVKNGVVTSGSYTAGNGELDNDYRHTHVNTDSVNLAFNWTPGEWKISGNAGTTKASGGTKPEYLTSFYATEPFSFAFDKHHTYLNVDSGAPSDPTMFSISPSTSTSTVNGVTGNFTYIGGIARNVYGDRESYAQADFERRVDFWGFNKVMFGLKASSHDNFDWGTGSNIYVKDLASNIEVGSLSWRLTPTNLYKGLGVTGNGTPYATLSPRVLMNFLNSGIYSDNGTQYGSDFDVKERVEDAYVQGNFRQDKLHGNVGARLAYTRDDSSYWLQSSDSNVFANTVHSYTKLLPQLNAVYDYSDHILLKGGIAEVMARPRYSDLAGTISVDNTTHLGGGGNPDLKPYLSTNYEGSFEYYFGKSGMFASEVFVRDISSYIIQGKISTQTLLDTKTQAMETYTITSPFNATNAKVHGIDFQYNTDLPYNFGIMTNVTYAEADTGTSKYNMPYLSRYTVNVIPYYENGPWQVRMSVNYRSKYFTAISYTNTKSYTDSYTDLSLSATYNVNKRVSLYVNATNLLDQTYYQFDGQTQIPLGQYKNGRVVSVGFSYKM